MSIHTAHNVIGGYAAAEQAALAAQAAAAQVPVAELAQPLSALPERALQVVRTVLPLGRLSVEQVAA